MLVRRVAPFALVAGLVLAGAPGLQAQLPDTIKPATHPARRIVPVPAATDSQATKSATSGAFTTRSHDGSSQNGSHLDPALGPQTRSGNPASQGGGHSSSAPAPATTPGGTCANTAPGSTPAGAGPAAKAGNARAKCGSSGGATQG